MNYKTYQDLSLTINKNLYKIPRDIDLVVGIPRSGMLPATMIGQILNKPVVALDSYLDGKIYAMGLYRRPKTFISNISEIKKVLIIDDSILRGTTINMVKEKIENSDRRSIQTMYSAVYYVQECLDKIDIGLEECPHPRIFQWNIMNSWVLASACLDIDGVVCVDPTEEQNDDGDKYKDFLLNAKPVFLTEFPISCFVTTRLEKYRKLTEEWLKMHNLNYNELIMLDLPTKEERIKQNIHAKFKADVYEKRTETLFIESNLSQAIRIAELTGKLVFCTENMQMISIEKNKSDLQVQVNINTPFSIDNDILLTALKNKKWEQKLGLYSKVFQKVDFFQKVDKPDISIIVISWRLHPDNLKNFQILEKQRHHNFELIFVDNGGKEGEFETLKPYVDTFVRLNKNTGAYLARNVGAVFAKAPILLFLEDDGIPEHNFVEAHLSTHRKFDVIAVRGVYRPKTDTPINERAKHYYMGDRPYPYPCNLEGNSSYRADSFYYVEGWDDEISFGYGGWDLAVRFLEVEPDQRKQIYSPDPVIYHDFATNAEHLSSKLKKHESSLKRLKNKHPQWDAIIGSWDEFAGRNDVLILKGNPMKRVWRWIRGWYARHRAL